MDDGPTRTPPLPSPDSWAFVLVHGGQHDGRCWRWVVDRLRLPAVAVDLPGRPAAGEPGGSGGSGEERKLSSLVRHVVDVVDGLPQQNVVLVGHSMAGLVLPNVSEECEKVRHAVYLSALLPDGRSRRMTDALPRLSLRLYLGRQDDLRLFGTKGAGAVWSAWLLGIRRAPEPVRREVVSHFVPEPNWEIDVAPPATSRTPKTWVLLLRDRSLSVRGARRMMRRLPGSYALRAVDGGHDAMVTHPAELATILDEIALAEATVQVSGAAA